jgi:hypothetical protein
MSDRPSGGDMTAAFSSALEGASAAPAVEASPASAPAQESTPTESTPAAATAQPVEPTPEPVPVSADAPETEPGTPPKWRWQDILANARETATKEAEARIRQEYDSKVRPFEGVDPSELAGYRVMQAALAGNPQAIAQIKQNPEALHALRSIVAEQQAAADPEPEADLQTNDGTPVYSAPQYAKREAWLKRQFMQDVQKELTPLKQMAQNLQEREQSAVYTNTLEGVIREMTAADPQFGAHKKDVHAAIVSNPKLLRIAIGDDRTDADPAFAVQMAWAEVHRTKVVPTLAHNSEAQTLATLQQRAVAGTVSATAPTASTPKKFSTGERGFADALSHYGQTASR